MPSIDRHGQTIHYEDVAGRGSPLLLIMGLGTPATGWHFQLPALAARHRVIAFDNRGCGRSTCPRTPFGIADMAADAVALLDRLDVPRAHVVGVSMGGMIAQELALAHPDRVSALVLASTYAAPPQEVLALHERNASLVDAPAALSDPIAALRFLTELAFTPDFIDRNAALLLDVMLRGSPEGPSLRGLRAQTAALLAHDARGRLGRIAAPTLVLTGDRDRMIPARCSAEIAALLPRARLATIEGGSHAVNFERPDEWNRAVGDFLAGSDTSPIRI